MNPSEFEQIEEDLAAAFAVAVPAMRFEAPMAPANMRRPGRRWVYAAGAAVAAGIVAAVAFLPGYLGGPTTVNAEELLSRSAAASSQLQSSGTPYHLRAKFAGNGGADFIAETWSFGTEGNRSEARSLDGELLYGQVATTNDYWIYATVDGSFRVAHVAGATDRLKDFVAGADSLDAIVQNLAMDQCQAAAVTGSATIAGRDAYVVEVSPTPESCAKTSASGAWGDGAIAKEADAPKFGGYTVWIDKETNVQLQFELRDENGNLTKQYSAESFETGRAAVDARVLAYSAPAGATVIETPDYSAAKSAIYAGTSEIRQHAPEPTKK
ncbi:MAG: hypothetical protein AB7N24_00105 [Dehalococcoidia bacterium]